MKNKSSNFSKIFALLGLAVLFTASLAAPALSLAQNSQSGPPENIDQAKEMGEKALEVTKTQAPGIISDVWKEEVVPVWKKMFGWAKEKIWDDWLSPWLKNLWATILRILKVEVENRVPGAQQEIQKEKEQIQAEAPQVGRSLWDKFLEIIK